MLKLAILFTCIVVVIEAQRQNLYLPYWVGDQQNQDQYLIRQRPIYGFPYFRLPTAGYQQQLNRQQFRLPAYYLVPAFPRQSSTDNFFPSNPSVAAVEDDSQCAEQEESPAIQTVDTKN